MNTTVMDLTARGLLGRRRALALLALPAVLIVLALLFRILGEPDTATIVRIINLGFGTVVPLLGVIVGTGAIGPEIEDGSILYLLSKPLSRTRIVLSKLIVAIAICCTLSAVALLAAGALLGGSSDLVVGYAVAAALAGAAYCAVFLLLAIVTRNAVIVGLAYALVWETTVAGVVPGARALSIRQWALSLAERIADDAAVASAVGLTVGLSMLVAVTVGATLMAVSRLRGLTLSGDV